MILGALKMVMEFSLSGDINFDTFKIPCIETVETMERFCGNN